MVTAKNETRGEGEIVGKREGERTGREEKRERERGGGQG